MLIFWAHLMLLYLENIALFASFRMNDNLLKLVFFIWLGLFFEKLLDIFNLLEWLFRLLLSIIIYLLDGIGFSFLDFELMLSFLGIILLLFLYLFVLCLLLFLDVFDWCFDDNDRLVIIFCFSQIFLLLYCSFLLHFLD